MLYQLSYASPNSRDPDRFVSVTIAKVTTESAQMVVQTRCYDSSITEAGKQVQNTAAPWQ